MFLNDRNKIQKIFKGENIGNENFFFKIFFQKVPSNDEKIVLNKFGGNNLYSAQNPKLPRGHHSSFPGILKEFFVKKVPQVTGDERISSNWQFVTFPLCCEQHKKSEAQHIRNSFIRSLTHTATCPLCFSLCCVRELIHCSVCVCQSAGAKEEKISEHWKIFYCKVGWSLETFGNFRTTLSFCPQNVTRSEALGAWGHLANHPVPQTVNEIEKIWISNFILFLLKPMSPIQTRRWRFECLRNVLFFELFNSFLIYGDDEILHIAKKHKIIQMMCDNSNLWHQQNF